MSDEDTKIDWARAELPVIDTTWSDRKLKKVMREAAEETMATMLVLMELGGLDIPQQEKEMISESFITWNECFWELKRRSDALKQAPAGALLQKQADGTWAVMPR